jgi:hypothetical protein
MTQSEFLRQLIGMCGDITAKAQHVALDQAHPLAIAILDMEAFIHGHYDPRWTDGSERRRTDGPRHEQS